MKITKVWRIKYQLSATKHSSSIVIRKMLDASPNASTIVELSYIQAILLQNEF